MNIGVRGVGGYTVATGIGNVQFTILNTDNVIEHITLNNIIYLPYCTKKLLSICCWSKHLDGNAGIFL